MPFYVDVSFMYIFFQLGSILLYLHFFPNLELYKLGYSWYTYSYDRHIILSLTTVSKTVYMPGHVYYGINEVYCNGDTLTLIFRDK